ncbi:MAG: (2Fe-2S)-binding protein [Chloroflexota bacterium]
MTSIRLPKYERGRSFEIEVDGNTLMAYEGETVATALLAADIRTFHHPSPGNEPGRLYCGMGVCMQCLVTVNGVPSCQACQMLAQPGMKVEIDR